MINKIAETHDKPAWVFIVVSTLFFSTWLLWQNLKNEHQIKNFKSEINFLSSQLKSTSENQNIYLKEKIEKIESIKCVTHR